MTTQHTPGPWEVGYCTWNDEGNVCYELRGIKQGGAADARLIAAAPELLSCLIEMVEVNDEPCRLDHHGYCQAHFLDNVNDGGCRVANSRAIIAKATGETK
jgi:hypothetical protein